MYIAIVPNRSSPPAILLREGYREGGKVKNRTLANLSSLPRDQVDAIRAVLRGEALRPVGELFEITASAHHGHIQAVRAAMGRLGFDRLLAARPSRERALVCAMVAARVVAPHTKLATTRWWQTTTLAEDLGVSEASEDELYAAMDWLLTRQGAIEQKLAQRHLTPGSLVLYDLTSSYFEGTRCPLARRGHNRDGKKNKLQVNYGLTTDRRGCPVAVAVFAGNTADSATLAGQVEKLRADFGIATLVLVGDRGMISQRAIDEELSALEGLAWITALKSERIRTLIAGGGLQLGLFDERNLFELAHADYPGERLIACRNPELKTLRAHTRESLLAATEKELEKVRAMVARGRLRGRDQIGVRVGKVVNKYKVAKHFTLDIDDTRFAFARRAEQIAAEAALDGIYVIRTSLPAAQMSADETVRSYKALSDVERAFRSLKTITLKVRPIHHWLADRVRSHIFLCMLAYYVEWHMREAWRPLLFADEDQEAKRTRDPVALARRSPGAEEKALTRRLPDGSLAHSFRTLLEHLATIVRNTCRTPGAKATASTFRIVTTPSPSQRRALELIDTLSV
jgi:transposase